MKKKQAMIGGGVVIALCCISSLCWWSRSMAAADAERTSGSAASAMKPGGGIAVGTRARHCWPGDSYDGVNCKGVNSCKSPDGKCNGGRVIVWDGQQWQACKYLNGPNFNCASTTPAAVAIPGFDASKVWVP